MLNGNYINYNMPQNGIPHRGMPNAPLPNTNISHGAVKDVVPTNLSEKLPENLQNIDAEQIANNNGAVSAMNGADPKTMVQTLGIYLPFIALRTVNDSSKGPFNFAGEWDKTFLGKLAHAGDKISAGISKIIPDSVENGVKNAARSVKNFAQKHSAVVRSLSTPVKLENKTALSEANGLLGRVLFDDATLFEKGYTGDVVQLFKDKGTGTFWNFVKSQNANIESLPAEEARKVVSDALRELGNKPKAEIQGCVDDLIDILSKSNEASSIRFPINTTRVKGLFGVETSLSKFSSTLKASAASKKPNAFADTISRGARIFEKDFTGDVVSMFKGKGTGEFWNFLLSKNANIETLPAEEARKVVSDALREFGSRPRADIQNYLDDFVDVLSKSNEIATKPFVRKLSGAFSHIPGFNAVSKGIRKFFTLDVPMSEVSNKLKVSSGKAGATALGCAMPSAFAKIYEGLTSDFVGGKVAPYLQAFFLMQAIKRAHEAPEGKKLSTFMDEETNAVSFLFTMPLATSLMTKAGGLKYIGMSGNTAGMTAQQLVQQQKNNVQLYRDMIKTLNEKVDKNILSRGEYINEVKKIKDVLKGDTKFWQRPLKALGKLVGSNYKAETIKPFIDDALPAGTSGLKQVGIKASNAAQTFMYKLKTGGFKLPFIGSSPTPGGILRFALVFFVLSPLVSKPIKAVVNKIFGKPYDPAAEKAEAEKKAREEAAKNNPFNKMSDAELMQLLSKNQNAIMDLQNHPEKMQEFQQNPQAFYDYLKANAAEYDKSLAKAPMSPALNSYINRLNNPSAKQPIELDIPKTAANQQQNYTQTFNTAQPQNPYMNNAAFNQPMMNTMPVNGNGFMNQSMNMNSLNQNAKMPAPNIQTEKKASSSSEEKSNKLFEPKRSYIPSSRPGDFSAVIAQDAQRFNSILLDMENTEKTFSRYLSL